MKIGLTGATGFLGNHLIDALVSGGHQVVAWHRHVDSATPRDGVQWIGGELGDPDAADELARQCDGLVHAGLKRTRDSFMADEPDPVDYFQTNVIGSLQLIEAATRHHLDRFVFISSGTVHERVDPQRPLDETHPLWPATLYGAYKASVETLVHAYGFSGKLSACTVRPTAIYGIADPIEQSKWYAMVRQIARGEDVQASGGSKEVHAADVAKAVCLLLQTDRPIDGETFNCSDRMISRYEVAQIAKRLSGSTATISGQAKQARHPMDTAKLRQLGFDFGGTELLESTVRRMLEAIG